MPVACRAKCAVSVLAEGAMDAGCPSEQGGPVAHGMPEHTGHLQH